MKKEKKWYLYLDGICGTELICSGSKEICQKIKEEKDKQWQIGYLWDTRLTDKPDKEYIIWD